MAAQVSAAPMTAHATWQYDEKAKGPGFLQVSLPRPPPAIRATPAALVFVLDNSGSMAGRPWLTVLSAMKSIEERRSEEGMTVRYIVYNTDASVLHAANVQKTKAHGMTNFNAAFKETIKVAQELKSSFSKIVVTFLTDGENTEGGDPERGLQKLSSVFKKDMPGVETVVHSIGFGDAHAFNFLERLRKMGSTEGSYRYADSSRESGNLEEKFAELFDFSAKSMQTTIDVGDGRGPQPVTAIVAGEELKIEAWLDVKAAARKWSPTSVHVDVVPPAIVPVEIRPPDGLFPLRNLEHRMARVDNKGQLAGFQAELSRINPLRLPRHLRQEGIELRSDLQSRLDAETHARADQSRSAGAASMLADLRYAAVFSKVRRQRAMDQRAAKNALEMEEAEKNLKALEVTAAAFEGVDLETFMCDVSQYNAFDAVEEGDVLGMGIVVRDRGEHLVDAPTCIEVTSFSVSIVSWQTFQLALRYKIPLEGAEEVLGGFSVPGSRRPGNDSASSSSTRRRDDCEQVAANSGAHALVGRAKEPINAWLPLYICPLHFEAVMQQLPPMLGMLFTLDPLGYKADQRVAMFTVLGQMHLQLRQTVGEQETNAVANERQLLLLHEYRRFCTALLPSAIESLGFDMVDNFIASAEGRTKAVVQNLITIVGWASARDISDSLLVSLQWPLLEEATRRQLSNHYKGFSTAAVWDVIKVLLYGKDAHGRGEVLGSAGGPAKRNKKIDKAFGDFAQHSVGLVKKVCLCPEWEEMPSSSFSTRELKPDTWDKETKAMVGELVAAVDLSVLKKAIRLPEMEDESKFLLTKAILVNSLKFYTNDLVNEGVKAGRVRLAYADPVAVLTDAHAMFQREEMLQGDAMQRTRVARRKADLIVTAPDIWSFCGRLMAACPTRGGEVWDNVAEMLKRPLKKPLHLHREKVEVAVLGKLRLGEEHSADARTYDIMAAGAPWLLTNKDHADLSAAIGEEAMTAISLHLVGNSSYHVYRWWPGDFPNRHGYCNSKPSDWAKGLRR
eukprot:TRINITY_DN19266_c0_g1_i1.p1 TRINITY_DN19266_c0_g1~~TRINITY_DN19266_c0_g1_i1.p1  ORF type:complete len:1013 (-),score=199.93 TRINITY_DN19266_c0_g1_i1:1547-4585(-)